MTTLQGKAAVITGSTSGIGQGIAAALAKEGVNIVLNGTREGPAAADQCEALSQRFGIEAVYHRADMTSPEEIASLIAAAIARFGRIDILVNNAGVQHVAPVEQFSQEHWDTILAINLSASFHTIRNALPGMKSQGWGRIIQVASVHSLVASPFKCAYVAAKHGLAGLTKTVALEVAREHITCNAICPGYVWTPLVAGQVADSAQAHGLSEEKIKSDIMLAAQPTRAFTTVEQIGAFVVFLCSPAADNVSGAILTMDGGWTAT